MRKDQELRQLPITHWVSSLNFAVCLAVARSLPTVVVLCQRARESLLGHVLSEIAAATIWKNKYSGHPKKLLIDRTYWEIMRVLSAVVPGTPNGETLSRPYILYCIPLCYKVLCKIRN